MEENNEQNTEHTDTSGGKEGNSSYGYSYGGQSTEQPDPAGVPETDSRYEYRYGAQSSAHTQMPGGPEAGSGAAYEEGRQNIEHGACGQYENGMGQPYGNTSYGQYQNGQGQPYGNTAYDQYQGGQNQPYGNTAWQYQDSQSQPYGHTAGQPYGSGYGNAQYSQYQSAYTDKDAYQKAESNSGGGFGIASMILGIISLAMFCTCLNIPIAAAAVVFGILQLMKGGRHSGSGPAIAGLITAGLSVLAFLATVLLLWGPFQDLYQDTLQEMQESGYENEFDFYRDHEKNGLEDWMEQYRNDRY